MKVWPAAITVPNLPVIDTVISGTIRSLDNVGIQVKSPAAFCGVTGDPLNTLRNDHRIWQHISISFLIEMEKDDVLYLVTHSDVVLDILDNHYLATTTLYRWVTLITEDVNHPTIHRKLLADIASIIEVAGFKECFYNYSKSLVDGIPQYRHRG